MSGIKGLVAILTISAATVSSVQAKILRGPYGSKNMRWCHADCEFFKGCTDYHYEDKKCTLYAAHAAPHGPEAKRPFDVSFASPDEAWCRKECEMTRGCDDYHFDSPVRECTLTGKSPTTDGPNGSESKGPCNTPLFCPDEMWCKRECDSTPSCIDYEFHKHEEKCALTCKVPSTPPPIHNHRHHFPLPPPEVKPCVIGETFITEHKRLCLKACELTPECHDVQYMDKECTCNDAPPPSPNPHKTIEVPYAPKVDSSKENVWKW